MRVEEDGILGVGGALWVVWTVRWWERVTSLVAGDCLLA